MATNKAMRGLLGAVAILAALAGARPLYAQIELGTWVRQVSAASPGAITMTVEACCGGSGRLLTYRMTGMEATMTVETHLDGTEAPVLLGGKPSGENMAIKRIDDHHAETVMTMNGKPFGTSKATLSADGKTLTVENDFTVTVGNQLPGRTTETWVRQ
jgi:3-methyladenine DNA glycosylase Mpg